MRSRWTSQAGVSAPTVTGVSALQHTGVFTESPAQTGDLPVGHSDRGSEDSPKTLRRLPPLRDQAGVSAP